MDSLALVGTTIAEKYAVESVVGEGGYAVVYRAMHAIWKRPVAIKVFRALDDVPAEHRTRLLDEFVQEGALLAELSEKSAAICQARDVGLLKTAKGAELPYMVLEWLEGATLEAVLADERARGLPLRSLADAARLLEPAAHALALAHTKGIAHRDVKPANVFVLGDPRGEGATVKLLDFGIAKVVQDAQKMAGSFTKTAGNVTSFTPAYGAPEQFSRTYGATGPWTDVFALALILVEMATGAAPLDGDDLSQLAFSSIDPNRRPTPRARGAEVGDATEQVFAKALAVSPTARWQSAAGFWRALRESLAMGPSVMMAGLPESSSRSPAASGGSAPPRGPDIARADTVLASPAAATVSAPSPPLAATPPFLPPVVVASSTGAGGVYSTQGAAGVAPARPASRRQIVLGLLGAAAVFAVMTPFLWKSGGVTRDRATTPLPSSVRAPSPPPPPEPARSAHSPPGGRAGCPPGMVHVPGGRFFMGNEGPHALANEKPVHQVQLSPYCIDAFEVTTRQYKACSDHGNCRRASTVDDWKGITAKEKAAYDPLCNMQAPEQRARHPINCVDWQMASEFCASQSGARLPTEAEWEFAARSPDGRTYPWGDDEPLGGHGHLNACGPECIAFEKKAGLLEPGTKPMYDVEDGFVGTAPVGSFPPGQTAYGALDMVGNVWEWTLDSFGEYQATEAGKPEIDPRGPPDKPGRSQRVIRGGAFNSTDPSWVRPSFRYMADPSMKSAGVGFRCVLPLSAAH